MDYSRWAASHFFSRDILYSTSIVTHKELLAEQSSKLSNKPSTLSSNWIMLPLLNHCDSSKRKSKGSLKDDVVGNTEILYPDNDSPQILRASGNARMEILPLNPRKTPSRATPWWVSKMLKMFPFQEFICVSRQEPLCLQRKLPGHALSADNTKQDEFVKNNEIHFPLDQVCLPRKFLLFCGQSAKALTTMLIRAKCPNFCFANAFPKTFCQFSISTFKNYCQFAIAIPDQNQCQWLSTWRGY